MKARFSLILLLGISAFAVAVARADGGAPTNTTAPGPNVQGQGLPSGPGRAKKLDFEDDVVEGMNRNPLDSAEDIAKRDGKGAGHLYQKRTDFRKEMKATTQEGGFTP